MPIIGATCNLFVTMQAFLVKNVLKGTLRCPLALRRIPSIESLTVVPQCCGWVWAFAHCSLLRVFTFQWLHATNNPLLSLINYLESACSQYRGWSKVSFHSLLIIFPSRSDFPWVLFAQRSPHLPERVVLVLKGFGKVQVELFTNAKSRNCWW